MIPPRTGRRQGARAVARPHFSRGRAPRYLPRVKSPTGETAELGAVRRLLLALTLLGIVGLAAELVLLEHYEDVWQWAPFVVLGGALLLGIAVALRPARAVL